MQVPFAQQSKLLLITTLSFFLSLGVFLFFLSSNGAQAEASSFNTFTADQVIVEVNNRRQEEGLPELVLDPKLSKAAEDKASHMSQYSYFSHIHKETGKKWSDFIKETGYTYSVAGENLANGFYTVDEMVDAWLASPTHRENIVNKNVNETGVGIRKGELNGNPTIFVVQVFGKEE